MLNERNLVKVGMWKCSGTISRNVCDCELLGESKGEQERCGLCRKGLMKWMNAGSVKMSTIKKDVMYMKMTELAN